MYQRYPDEYYNHLMMDGSYSWVGMLIHVLVWAAIIAGAIYVIRMLVNRSNTSSPTRDPLDIARERYARGEITKDDLADIKKELEKK